MPGGRARPSEGCGAGEVGGLDVVAELAHRGHPLDESVAVLPRGAGVGVVPVGERLEPAAVCLGADERGGSEAGRVLAGPVEPGPPPLDELVLAPRFDRPVAGCPELT